MLEQVLFLLFVNPAFPDAEEIYDSGIKYVEESYESDKPATQYPLLTIEAMVQASDYNILKPGIYAVEPTQDNKTIRFYQGAKLIAETTVVQIIEHDYEMPVAEAKIGLVKNEQIIIVYKKDNLEIHAILYKFIPF